MTIYGNSQSSGGGGIKVPKSTPIRDDASSTIRSAACGKSKDGKKQDQKRSGK